jgi:hypothetical protein
VDFDDVEVAAPWVAAATVFLLEEFLRVEQEGVEGLERRGEGVVALAADGYGFSVGIRPG